MQRLLHNIATLALEPYAEDLARLIERKDEYICQMDADGKRFLKTFRGLPEVTPSSVDLDDHWVKIGERSDLTSSQHEKLLEALRHYCPWRKGPFNLFGIEIDSEWVSALKWSRVKDHIAPLAGRKVLDIGSSCGYYLFRMASSQPKMALGVEPYLTFYFQYRLLQHYARQPDIYCLPVKFEELPEMTGYFDTIFSMGILYHRRSPIDTMVEMRRSLRRGGELVLETLVIEEAGDMCLCPAKRYAKMNNVFFIPTVSCLTNWLQRAGFENIRCVDIAKTTSAEQRKTEWIQTESLEDFLDPADRDKTVEGYPSPVRAILIANVR